MLGQRGCEEQLLSLLNAILDRTGKNRLKTIEIIENRTLNPELLGAKKSILDIRAKLEDCTKINIEVQLQNKYNMNKRSLFYSACG
jgi:predicted transposase/invertase (TIGR01784 family)